MRARIVTILVLVTLLVPSAIALGQGGSVVKGTINDERPFIKIPIVVEEDGTTIIADVVSTTGDLDTLLYLVDSSGNILEENDDRAKGDPSSLLEFPEADKGEYTLVATRYKVVEGGSSGDFELEIRFDTGTGLAGYDVSAEALAAAGFPEIAPREKAEWTVLAYYGGDNNLEPGILNDFNEFEIAGGSTDRVRIVALVDRSPDFTDSNGNWDTVKLFEIGTNDTVDAPDTFPPTVDSVPLADLGERDTGFGETLAQFLVWSIRHYPAEHYVISFGSHGAGWAGLVTDDTSENTILSLPELQTAFDLALAENGGVKFDLLVNDACLMSSVEYFARMSAYFNYALASPEIVVDPALDMTSLINMLKGETPIDFKVLGTSLVDTYIKRDILKREKSDVAYLTHAVTDLNQFDPVVQAVEDFARIVNRSPAVYSTLLGDARANTYTYSSFLGGDTKVDLGSFMRRIIALSTDRKLIDAAEKTLVALNNARIYGNAGELVFSRTSYYNIYFPDASKDFKLEYFEQSPLEQWGKMLRNYYNSVTPQVWSGGGLELGFHLPIAPKIQITNSYPADEVSIATSVELGLEIVGRRLAYGDFTVDQIQPDGSARRLSSERMLTRFLIDDETQLLNWWRPGVQITSWSWDVRLPVITDGTNSFNELIIFTESVGFLDGRYREPGSDVWNEVGVIFNFDEVNRGGEMQRIVNREDDSGALAVIDITPGAEFQAYSSVVTPDGRVIQAPGNTYTWPEGGLTWRWEAAPNGQYDLGFLLTAYGGTTGFTSTQVAVNNDNVDTNLRLDTWFDVALSLPRRADWSLFGFSDEDFLIRSVSADESENITAYLMRFFEPDLAAIVDEFLTGREYTLSGEAVETDLSGIPALEVAYTYDGEAGPITGRGIAFFNEWVGVGMVLAAEALEGTGDLQATFDLLSENVVPVDMDALSEADTTTWDTPRTRKFGKIVEIPVRLDWVEAETEEDETRLWKRYAPAAEADGPTFLATAFMPTDSDDVGAVLTQAVADYATPGAGNFEVTDERTYYGQQHTWEAVLFTAERAGAPVIGRVYATIEDGISFVIWVETLNDDNAKVVFEDVLEPMVDGYVIETE